MSDDIKMYHDRLTAAIKDKMGKCNEYINRAQNEGQYSTVEHWRGQKSALCDMAQASLDIYSDHKKQATAVVMAQTPEHTIMAAGF